MITISYYIKFTSHHNCYWLWHNTWLSRVFSCSRFKFWRANTHMSQHVGSILLNLYQSICNNITHAMTFNMRATFFFWCLCPNRIYIITVIKHVTASKSQWEPLSCGLENISAEKKTGGLTYNISQKPTNNSFAHV